MSNIDMDSCRPIIDEEKLKLMENCQASIGHVVQVGFDYPNKGHFEVLIGSYGIEYLLNVIEVLMRKVEDRSILDFDKNSFSARQRTEIYNTLFKGIAPYEGCIRFDDQKIKNKDRWI